MALPFFAAIVSITLSRLVYNVLSERLLHAAATVICIAIAAILYGAACFALGVIKKKDIAEILGSKDKSEENENDRSAEKRKDRLPSG